MNTNTHYSKEFYQSQANDSEKSANVVVPMLMSLFSPQSVVDVGCGVGTWLSSFTRHGVADVCGMDGDYVSSDALRIPPDRFLAANLLNPLPINRRFDLALCLEVGEHLPQERSRSLIAELARLADVVAFSAAIPGQGGTYHINEQWPEFWSGHFESQGYKAIDCLRDQIWQNHDVADWYSQNLVLYVSADVVRSNPKVNKLMENQATTPPLRRVHPKLFGRVCAREQSLRALEEIPTIGWAAQCLLTSIRSRVGAKLKRAFSSFRTQPSI